MIISTVNLKKVSTYAKDKNISAAWVYKLAEKGKVEIVQIDGVKFVNIKEMQPY